MKIKGIIHLSPSHEEKFMIRSLFRPVKRNWMKPNRLQKLLQLLGVKKG